ncbi:UBP-type zinc finger domain-containing protein [Micromonospora sp. LZ34]
MGDQTKPKPEPLAVTAAIDPAVPPSGPGCMECDSSGGWWFHLRRCAACGHVGCCDSSPSQHATAHAAVTGHAVIQSFEPGESWFWDYSNGQFYADGPALAEPHSHPSDQPAPGPRGRVPEDWKTRLH